MTVLRGDCVEVMAGMEPDSVDAIVCDPPYDLLSSGDRNGSGRSNPGAGPFGRTEGRGGFMGQRWDATGVAFRPETWAAALRVAKPGAYLLAFGGTRTVHRMTCALEDAGWVIRDMLVWAYAQGFPKSRASLKPAWEPIVLCRKPGASRDLNIDAARIGTTKDVPASVSSVATGSHGVYGTYGLQDGTEDGHNPNVGRWPANVILTDPILDGGWDGVVGGGESSTGAFPGEVARKDRADYRMPSGSGPARTMDSGTYSRFFLIPKAPTRERTLSDGRRSPHPTQKPEALIRHLVQLITPRTVPVIKCETCEWQRDQDLHQLRAAVRGQGRVEGQDSGFLLPEVRGGASTTATGPLSGMRATVPAEVELEPVLFTDLLEPSGGPDPQEHKGLRGQREGVHPPVPPRPSDGDADGLRGGTPAGDGRDLGPDAETDRGRGSHQRREERQPAGEPAGDDGPSAQQPAQARKEAHRVSALPLDDPDFGSCPACGGRLASGVRPGVVLDCFLGSGTLGVVCDGLGMRWQGIEREPEYADWAEDRIRDGKPSWEAA